MGAKYVRCIAIGDDPISLTVGEIYETLGLTAAEQKDGWLRIIDNEGEPYLHPAQLFEPIDEAAFASIRSEAITIHLTGLLKLKIRDAAHAKGISLGAFLREVAEERLDLPEALQSR
ncbi:MAG: hypothetical protein DYG89_48285 [Caldilinea sp. CFX5]|nr:hypothetical protein [Caldilinea sp. CFX5]